MRLIIRHTLRCVSLTIPVDTVQGLLYLILPALKNRALPLPLQA